MKHWRSRFPAGLLLLSMILGVMPGAVFSAPRLTTGLYEQNKLPMWELKDEHFSLLLVQRLPDQSRGYFQARGFSIKDSETIAQSCVFQTIFKNISNESKNPGALSYDLKEWEVLQGNNKSRLKTREDWAREWDKKKVSQPARIAFEWSLLPTKQHYKPGDYNWGMTSFGFKPGTRFDLVVTWHQHGKQHRARIPNVICAPDIEVNPVNAN